MKLYIQKNKESDLSTTPHCQKDAQPLSVKLGFNPCNVYLQRQTSYLQRKTSSSFAQSCVMKHNIVWYGISLWAVQAGCTEGILPAFVMLGLPTWYWDRVGKTNKQTNKECLDAVQALFSKSQDSSVLSILY